MLYQYHSVLSSANRTLVLGIIKRDIINLVETDNLLH
jgi:hypothetical protein